MVDFEAFIESVYPEFYTRYRQLYPALAEQFKALAEISNQAPSESEAE